MTPMTDQTSTPADQRTSPALVAFDLDDTLAVRGRVGRSLGERGD